MEIDRSKISPMMNQYLDAKEAYPDTILFFRVGDFYEMFFNDALLASKTLELTLTGKDCGLEERAPMCGVPHHSSEIYIKKLIEAGYKVAICEQLTDPAESKGLVQRDVIRVVTPGTLIESSMLNDENNNYICCAYYDNEICGMCFADISTGEVRLAETKGKNPEPEIIDLLSRYTPSEVIFNSEFLSLKSSVDFIKAKLGSSVTLRESECFNPDLKKEAVFKQFSVSSMDMLGLAESGADVCAVCGLFDYIGDTQKTLTGRFTAIERQDTSSVMALDLTARRNLELTETLRNKEKKGSLLWVLDSTKTSMGKRLLKSYIEQPLTSPARIIDRLEAVEQFVKNPVVLMEVGDILERVYDIERLMTRVMYKTATPRDLKSLSVTSLQLPCLKEQLKKLSGSKLLNSLESSISTLEDISNLVENAIIDEPPVSVKDGGVIKDGFNEELDSLRHIMTSGKDIIAEIEQREREQTGIKGLKIGFNRVFGYYIEVTRSYYDLVPDRYIRKQTLANCERFITEELKNAENNILGAKDKALRLEADIFSEIRDFLASKLQSVQRTASAVAAVDVLASFADVSMKNNYTRPEIAIDGVIDIHDGRHPVVELMLTDEVFVPNDIYLDTGSSRMSIITGPNMSGKSTYMRQTALITLMAQIGCFVPASYAKISIVDRIFTRVGASDDLTAGQSTFMVEMSEVADILKFATKNSLVILDEVGRGTSTFDGISIARAVAEHICNSRSLGCKTLFATHYHELIELENIMDGVKNYSIAVRKNKDGIRFLRKIVRGGVDESYGIEVAKLAGLPEKVVKRARELLAEMELENKPSKASKQDDGQMTFGSVSRDILADRLIKTNVAELTDSECRELLEELAELAAEK
ncbi:DNA mismatch repair protein MutS [Porcipelethomonas sp.]|uniref:DNA mismatch repair protein MutS n=1 Tax=Porcipelethomonas sp. TaxID=2981675 RepID=UPI003EF9504B